MAMFPGRSVDDAGGRAARPPRRMQSRPAPESRVGPLTLIGQPEGQSRVWKWCGNAVRATPEGVALTERLSGGVLLSHTLAECSTIGAGGLSFRVRNGTGRFPSAMAAVTL